MGKKRTKKKQKDSIYYTHVRDAVRYAQSLVSFNGKQRNEFFLRLQPAVDYRVKRETMKLRLDKSTQDDLRSEVHLYLLETWIPKLKRNVPAGKVASYLNKTIAGVVLDFLTKIYQRKECSLELWARPEVYDPIADLERELDEEEIQVAIKKNIRLYADYREGRLSDSLVRKLVTRLVRRNYAETGQVDINVEGLVP